MRRGEGLYDSRGISPVVATVLLVLLMIALFVIVFWWANNFIGEQINKFDEPIDDACDSVELTVSVRGCEGGSGDCLAVVNDGNINVYAIEVRAVGGGDETLIGVPNSNIPVGESKVLEYSVDSDFLVDDDEVTGGGPSEELTVYPVLLGEGDNANKRFTCLDYGISV